MRISPVDYDSTAIPTSWGVNLVVAGAQVSLSTTQPDVLKLLKPKQGELKGSHHFVRQNSKLTASFDYIQIYNKKCDALEREVRNM